MESLIQNVLASTLLISALGYLIFRLGNKVKSFSNKWTPGCHDVQDNKECNNCLIAPKNRGIISTLQKTL